MSGIDDVIARSRRGGGFAKRKTFTLARQRGIRKMREFALADPSYYVLELIQSAVGNHASYINIEYDDDTLLFSYVGGRLTREEMAHLFDFLFASKDKLEVAHLRELALGINALLLFEPSQIVLESGDGTIGNTHRMVLRGVEDIIDIGRADEALNGTYLHAAGLKRKNLEARGMSCMGERMAIESRCLTAPVLITVNNEAPFGYKRMRIPKLWGYHPTAFFDEGDLYGVIGLSGWDGPTSFRILTHGVWIQTIEHELVPGAAVGGIINFDRLRKTADHSAIVHDDVFEEMWIRVRPYVQRLISNKKRTPTLHDVAVLDGARIPPGELRGWLRRNRRVVAVPNELDPRSDPLVARARAICRALGAPAVQVPGAEVASLRHIAGPEVDVVAPTLASDDEVEFYRQPPAGPPVEPYLASPQEAVTVGLGDLARAVIDATMDRRSAFREEETRRLTEALGGVGQVNAMLYATERPGPAGSGAWAQVLVSERLVWEGELSSPYPGQWLVVRMGHAAPSVLTATTAKKKKTGPDNGPPLARAIAQAVLELSRDQQASLHRAALRNLLRRRGSLGEAGRTLAMQALAQRALVRLRAPARLGDPPEVGVAWLDDGADMLDLHVFRTLNDTEFSTRELVTNMRRTHGLVYGVIPEVAADLDGLDRRRILELDQESERMLVSLLGEAAYVRVDRRDVLAAHRGVNCRDLALGLRRYPDFPLLVEGVDPTDWPAEEQRTCVAALVKQLVACFFGLAPPQPENPRAFPDWEENRRQACRHLQYFACTAPEGEREMVAEVPLFLDERGRVHTPRAVWAAFAAGHCLVTYRGRLASDELGQLSAAAARGLRQADGEPVRCLTASPYLAQLLARLGCVRAAYDFDFTDEEAARNPTSPDTAYLEHVRIHEREMVGCIGVPVTAVERPAIVVLDAGGRVRATLLEESRQHDVVGYVRLVDGAWDEARRDDLATAIERASERLVGDLIFKLGELASDEEVLRQRAEQFLLSYAARHLVLSATPTGAVVPWVARPTAQAVLDLPLFSTADGYAVSAWRLVSEFCAFGVAAFDDPERETALRQALAAGLPDHLIAWIRKNLVEERVIRLAAADARRELSAEALPVPGDTAFTTLRRTLTYWLERLRPDSYTGTGASHAHVDVVIGHELFDPTALGLTATRRWQHLNRLARPDSGGSQRARGEFAIFDIDTCRLYLNRHHWLVEETIESQCDPDWVAWLLLGCYAFINEVLEPVTNEHEQQFQVRVAEALAGRELVMID